MQLVNIYCNEQCNGCDVFPQLILDNRHHKNFVDEIINKIV